MANFPSVFQYSPELARVLYKTAEPYQGLNPADRDEPPVDEEDRQLPRHPALHAVKTIGAGLAGTGVGMLAGRGSYELLRKATGDRIPPSPLATAMPLIGGGAGLAYGLYKQHELEELQRALQAHKNRPQNPGH
jgi:hypothetical protein